MFSTRIKIQTRPTLVNKRKKRYSRTVARAPKNNETGGVNWKYTEAVNGRAAMYGTMLGTLNWGLTGLNVIEQTHFLPFALLGCGTSLVAIGTMTDAVQKLPEESFDDFATINMGRVSMVLFAGLVAAAIADV
uniref:Uncharacterized protein n=1 Tax=Bathycoccus sp. RCC716 virus 2 TaxID=2530039 RepID=A0A7S6NYL6_9PHYC|nr:hypothetical protein [Bathycoccus sp. RCC716 virus 2]|tara:strand:+ start:1109 stop:1507 length:399 start_codon:yes stop_codon:yes gene_type:complete